jgi:hypothetical protein
MGKTINVKYKIYVVEEGIKLPKYLTTKYTTFGYKMYNNVQYKLASIDKCAMLLFHFLAEKMDESNNVTHTEVIRNEFMAHAKKNLNLDFKDDTIKKAFYQLVKEDLIIKYKLRSEFTLNPRHVFKSTEEDRKKLIQTLINTFSNFKSNTKSNYKKALGIK